MLGVTPGSLYGNHRAMNRSEVPDVNTKNTYYTTRNRRKTATANNSKSK